MTWRLIRETALAVHVALATVSAMPIVAAAQATTAPPPAQGSGTPPCPAAALACANGLCRLDLAFPATDKCTIRIDDAFIRRHAGSSRITEKTTLRIRVVDVNLLRYAVKFETKETVIESYVFLEKLWKQILGLGTFGGLVPPAGALAAELNREKAFIDAINAWRAGLDAETKRVDAFVNGFTTLTLTVTQKEQIASELNTLSERLATLADLQATAKRAISRVEHFAVYDETLRTHQVVADKNDAFGVLAAQIAVGFEKKVPFGTAGRVVAVTITATDKGTGKEQLQLIGVEFLVHSTLPVTFHAGYTVRALDELKFEAVASSIQTAGGADLFAKVQDSDANGTFTAFMSYRLCDISRATRCPHLTIGTDFKDVGDRLYGGVSWPLGRAFVTAGVVSGESEEAEGPVSDVLGAAGQVTGARELFTVVSTKRKWGVFAGFSFAPF